MKTIIWDYNGTIIDDTEISVIAENRMLKERGLKYGYSVEDYRAMFSLPMEDYYRKLGYTFKNESFHDVAKEFNDIYDDLFDQCSLCKGVKEKLTEAEDKGYQNVILSSCEDKKLHEQCITLGIASYFKEIMGIDNLLGGSKIDIGKHWMIRSGVMPDECLYFGDTSADYETAEALGITNIILVASGHQSYSRLRNITDHVVHDLTEVVL